jgi:hypothetical protein
MVRSRTQATEFSFLLKCEVKWIHFTTKSRGIQTLDHRQKHIISLFCLKTRKMGQISEELTEDIQRAHGEKVLELLWLLFDCL